MAACTDTVPLQHVSIGHVCRNIVNMADEGSADTFEYPINGRILTLRKISKAQLEMLQRYVDSLQRKSVAAIEAKDAKAIVEIGKKMNDATWTTVESQFLISDDLEWVQMEVLAGRIVEKDLYPLLSNGFKRTVTEDDADPVPAKRPGRKAAAAKKAAPVKKAAAPRAKR